jgi:hypothetical protein
MLMFPNAAQLGSTFPVDHHAAAVLPIAVANEFPWIAPAKKFSVYICQKFTSFLVNHIVQHKADAAVNNNEFCVVPPDLDQLTNKLSILMVGDNPNIKCTTCHKNLA